ncbi:MAG: hypothetical protein AB8H47_31285 [Bacteroidia bacterium]
MKFNPISTLKRSVSFATVCLLLAGLVLIPACQNPADDFIPAKAENITDADITAAMDQAAPVVAEMLNDIEVRNLVKEYALKQFDGDYDVLYKDLAIQQLRKSETFGQRFTSKLAAQVGSEVEAERLINMIPRFHISVPVNAEKWDTESFVPSVVVSPFHLDESEYETYQGYAADGRAISLSSRVDPAVPVVALGVNERTYDDGRVRPEFLAVDNSNHRTSGDYETLNWIRIPNLSGVEGWAAGKPELTMIVIGARGMGTMSNAVFAEITKKVKNDISRSDIQAGKSVGLGLFNWKTVPTSSNTTTYGDEIKIKFIEIDDKGGEWKFSLKVGGDVKVKEPTTGLEITLPLPTLGVEYKFKAKDDDCGDGVVDFSHPKPAPYNSVLGTSAYNTGTVHFKMN